MCIKFVYFVLFISSVCGRHMPRYADLDDEDQHLLRAAYDTPSYDHDEYQEDNDMPLGKLDLLKDGLWAVKAKIKELKAFNKALAANFLSTKLKVKELIAASLVLKKHSHGEVEKKKPAYNYQTPSYQPQYAETQYAPQYAPPQPQHQHDPYYGQ
ncbi:hypothetical protein PYW08_002195 [Mythimna loreyi]|uniref:Uncharacterized protein n=1 Tax=Mythimna loreyi TaxID=667449 RepID=A0ACC2R140_9NEOP|nr:hypothetical protein PYW08_002195 [Mythimna loreyi]